MATKDNRQWKTVWREWIKKGAAGELGAETEPEPVSLVGGTIRGALGGGLLGTGLGVGGGVALGNKIMSSGPVSPRQAAVLKLVRAALAGRLGAKGLLVGGGVGAAYGLLSAMDSHLQHKRRREAMVNGGRAD
jgi:hypothetical protein